MRLFREELQMQIFKIIIQNSLLLSHASCDLLSVILPWHCPGVVITLAERQNCRFYHIRNTICLFCFMSILLTVVFAILCLLILIDIPSARTHLYFLQIFPSAIFLTTLISFLLEYTATLGSFIRTFPRTSRFLKGVRT